MWKEKQQNAKEEKGDEGKRKGRGESGEEEEHEEKVEEGRWMCNLLLYLIWPEVSPHKRFRPSGNKQPRLSCMSMTSQDKTWCCEMAARAAARIPPPSQATLRRSDDSTGRRFCIQPLRVQSVLSSTKSTWK